MKLSDLFTDESKWTKLTLARDKDDANLDNALHQDACKFCLAGGLFKIYGDICDEQYHIVLNTIRKLFPKFEKIAHVCDFNDDSETTFEDIQRVIAECKL